MYYIATYFLLLFAVVVISFPFLALQGVPFHYYANIQRQQWQDKDMNK